MVYAYKHPNSKKGTVAEHVLVMTKILGRPLRKGEQIHHKNGIKTDNRPENLELWTKQHPSGQRVSDLIVFASRILSDYSDLAQEMVFGGDLELKGAAND